MPKTKSSLREKARSSVSYAYQARGRKNHNLWLVYSVKTDKDWVLSSDRQFIYWIHYLETNPDVASYELKPTPISVIVHEEIFPIELDAIVRLKSNALEWHKFTGERIVESDQSDALLNAATEADANLQLISEDDLKRNINTAMRWLKVISYAASIRGHSYSHTEASLWTAVQLTQGGLIEHLLTSLIEEEESVVMALLARFSMSGKLYLDLAKNGYSRRTPWHLTTQL